MTSYAWNSAYFYSMQLLRRLFGNPNTIIKDPDLGKLRYLESQNGPVWSGKIHHQNLTNSITYFIDSEVKLLKSSSKSTILELRENLGEIMENIRVYFIQNHPLNRPETIYIEYIHLPENTGRYTAELICSANENEFSALLHGLEVIDIIQHED